MLDECLSGYAVRETHHHFRISKDGRVYPSLPNGEHGKRAGRAEIQVGHVRRLVEFFGIKDCAKKHIELL